jgi:hypothetical protein
MAAKSSQKAGHNSQLVHVDTLMIGVDEKRVREIVDDQLVLALKDFSTEANAVAKERNVKFGNALIGKMVRENALDAFADPAFQILLLEAQKRAASTERENDYDLLVELLLHRFQKGVRRSVRAGVSRAVEVVDQISDEALLGLTIFHAVTYFIPKSGNLDEGLKILDELFEKLISDELPTGIDWLDHLDILDAVRVSSLGGTKLLEDYWYENFDGYVKNGIRKDSNALSDANSILSDHKLSSDTLTDNQFDPDYVKLGLLNKSMIDKLMFNYARSQAAPIPRSITKEEKEALQRIYDLYDGSGMSKEDFAQTIDQYGSLKKLRAWWNTLQGKSIQITSVGRVLAHSNAQRIDRSLPALD